MASYNWRGNYGAFGVACNWANASTGENPATTVTLGGTTTGAGSTVTIAPQSAIYPINVGNNGTTGVSA